MKKNIYNFPISSCPHCGGGKIAIRQYICGYGEYYVDLKTGDVDTAELHSGLQYRNTGKYAVCADCGIRLFEVDRHLHVIEE